MDSAWLVPLSLAFGLVVGIGISVVVVVAASRGQRAVDVTTQAVPDGVEQVIEAMDSAGVVVDPSNNVLTASSAALAFGLVWNQQLIHPELVALVDKVRRNGEPIAQELHLARGPFGEANIYLFVRIA